VKSDQPKQTPFTIAAALVTTWVATGNAGMLSHPVRHLLALLGAATVAILLTANPKRKAAAPLFRSTAIAIGCFMVYRVVFFSVPPVWTAANVFARALGATVGAAVGQPLRIGPTFAGIDFLVLMALWFGICLAHTPSPRKRRALVGTAAILGAHLAYLLFLSQASRIAALLPEYVAPSPDAYLDPDAPVGEALWLSTLRHMTPWSFPAIGALLHAAAAALLVPMLTSEDRSPRGRSLGALAGTTVFAILLAFTATFCPSSPSLAGKHVLINEEGFLNWLKPEHGDYGRLSIGMYGMLSRFLESLGATSQRTTEFSADELSKADLLILIYPDEPWTGAQAQRIRTFVEEGGSLWVFGEHTAVEDDGGMRFNEIIDFTEMEVLFDSATFKIGGWLQSYDTMAHPVTTGVPDDRNQFGLVIGASLETHWPAYPLILGKWGWSDWGDPEGTAMMGDHVYNPGEQLGDLVLAAEQRVGEGRVVLFGDTSSISNGINIGANPFMARMLGYLANDMGGPQSAWRWPLALLLAVGLGGILIKRRSLSELALAIIALSVTATALTHDVNRKMALLPDAARMTNHKLAYVDTSHIGAFSTESWRNDGLMGLNLNLMRSDYLVLNMPAFSPERLQKADLFISVTPMRPYSAKERDAILRFVEDGGILVITAGYDAPHPTRELLRAFGLELGDGSCVGPACNAPCRGPIPAGFFKAPFYDTGEYMSFVRFHAAWPVHSHMQNSQPLAYGRGDSTVMLMQPYGQGKVVLVGDPFFAVNKNLEVESGEPFEGMRENPHFWRWLLTYLENEPLWVPPHPVPENGDSEEVSP